MTKVSGAEEGGRLGVRILVIALAVQLVLAGAIVYFSLEGWPWVGGGRDADPVPAARTTDKGSATPAVPTRFAASPGDGVQTPRVDRFDQDAAFALLRRQVATYGPRPAGSASLRRLARDLRARLPHGRLEPVTGHPGLNNVVGHIPGRKPAILVGAHYDVEARPTGFVGANDGAAGTAAVVQVAGALAKTPRPKNAREVRFVLFDGEEEPPGKDLAQSGLRGSRAYTARHGDEIGSMVLLDYIANRGVRFPREQTSDAALWRRVRAAARRVGVERSFPASTGVGIFDDHSPFLDDGIPAVDLIDFDYPWRDTLEDTVDKVTPRSLDVAGETVLDLVRRERTR